MGAGGQRARTASGWTAHGLGCEHARVHRTREWRLSSFYGRRPVPRVLGTLPDLDGIIKIFLTNHRLVWPGGEPEC